MNTSSDLRKNTVNAPNAPNAPNNAVDITEKNTEKNTADPFRVNITIISENKDYKDEIPYVNDLPQEDLMELLKLAIKNDKMPKYITNMMRYLKVYEDKKYIINRCVSSEHIDVVMEILCACTPKIRMICKNKIFKLRQFCRDKNILDLKHENVLFMLIRKLINKSTYNFENITDKWAVDHDYNLRSIINLQNFDIYTAIMYYNRYNGSPWRLSSILNAYINEMKKVGTEFKNKQNYTHFSYFIYSTLMRDDIRKINDIMEYTDLFTDKRIHISIIYRYIEILSNNMDKYKKLNTKAYNKLVNFEIVGVTHKTIINIYEKVICEYKSLDLFKILLEFKNLFDIRCVTPYSTNNISSDNYLTNKKLFDKILDLFSCVYDSNIVHYLVKNHLSKVFYHVDLMTYYIKLVSARKEIIDGVEVHYPSGEEHIREKVKTLSIIWYVDIFDKSHLMMSKEQYGTFYNTKNGKGNMSYKLKEIIDEEKQYRKNIYTTKLKIMKESIEAENKKIEEAKNIIEKYKNKGWDTVV